MPSGFLLVLLLCSGYACGQTCVCNGTAAPPGTAAPMTPAPVQSLTTPISVDIAVLTVGIALLLLLFAVSFYYTVIWPKRAFLEYRRRFEALVREEFVTQDMKLLKIGSEKSPLYGGAAGPNGDRQVRRIPTMREIESSLAAAQTEEEMSARSPTAGGGALANTVDL